MTAAKGFTVPGTVPVAVYPLAWPIRQDRTKDRGDSRFSVTFLTAFNDLCGELVRFDALDARVSMNVPCRADGSPVAAAAQRVNDPGVALTFNRYGQRYVIACDNYRDVRSNVRALGATIECLRRIEQYGSAALMEQSLSGFLALPPSGGSTVTERPWHVVLGVSENASGAEVERAFRAKALTLHPDRGGSHDAFAELGRARMLAESAVARRASVEMTIGVNSRIA